MVAVERDSRLGGIEISLDGGRLTHGLAHAKVALGGVLNRVHPVQVFHHKLAKSEEDVGSLSVAAFALVHDCSGRR